MCDGSSASCTCGRWVALEQLLLGIIGGQCLFLTVIKEGSSGGGGAYAWRLFLSASIEGGKRDGRLIGSRCRAMQANAVMHR